jgi:hypothetical protein
LALKDFADIVKALRTAELTTMAGIVNVVLVVGLLAIAVGRILAVPDLAVTAGSGLHGHPAPPGPPPFLQALAYMGIPVFVGFVCMAALLHYDKHRKRRRGRNNGA